MRKKGTGLLSESELAAWLRVSQRSVRRFVDAGELTRVRVGHAPAYIWDDVLRFAGVARAGSDQGAGRAASYDGRGLGHLPGVLPGVDQTPGEERRHPLRQGRPVAQVPDGRDRRLDRLEEGRPNDECPGNQ